MSDINTELGNTSTAQITLNDTNVRTLLQRTSAQSLDFGVTWTTKTIPQKFTPGQYGVSTIFPIF